MKEYKEKKMLSRSEIVARLRSIADEVEQGSITAGAAQVPLPEEGEFEFELKSDKLEIEVEFPLRR